LIIVVTGRLQNYLSPWLNLDERRNFRVPPVMADVPLL
jgi:hypothetical protein